MHDPNLVVRASGFHPWDAMAPAALSGKPGAVAARSSYRTRAIAT